MARARKTGDRVAWRSSGGGSLGRVERKLRRPAGSKAMRSRHRMTIPNFWSVSDKSGKVAAHKPSALRRVK